MTSCRAWPILLSQKFCEEHTLISQRLRLEILRARLRGERQYVLAQRAGIHPTTLSQILRGSIAVEFGDERIVRLGALLGLSPRSCFVRRRGQIAAQPKNGNAPAA